MGSLSHNPTIGGKQMTTQKAIQSMKNIIEYCVYKPSEVEAAILAIKALEKQIPKKVTRDSMNSPALCPCCHTDKICKSLDDGCYKYYTGIKNCPECWQKLVWG